MDSCKKPITYWFKAMWWFTTRKSGINATNLKELLGLGSCGTVWNRLQKLRRCTIRPGREKLSGRVEVDEFFVGGHRSGKRGRGSEGKTILAVAVKRCPIKKKIGCVRLQVALDCSGYSLEIFIFENIESGSTIVSDTCSGYQIINKEQFTHRPTNQSKTKDKEGLYRVHLVTTLVRRLIRGTYQGRFESKYLQNYHDEYSFRFNRRKSRSIKALRLIVPMMVDGKSRRKI